MTESGNEGNDSANAQNKDDKANNPDTGSGSNDQTKTVTMTQEELDKIITARLDKAKRSWEKETADREKAEHEKAEIEKLQGDEKLKRQHQLEIEKLQQERDLYSRDLKIAKAQASLSAKGLDPEFASKLIGATDEETNANIENFAKMVDAQVAKTIKANAVKGAPPATGGNGTGNDPIRDAIRAGFGLKD